MSQKKILTKLSPTSHIGEVPIGNVQDLLCSVFLSWQSGVCSASQSLLNQHGISTAEWDAGALEDLAEEAMASYSSFGGQAIQAPSQG